jgi:predicted flap endonuclease-1-like 5' DNA nuclease
MNSSNNWLLFILILIIIVILVWALLRNRPKPNDLPAHHDPEKPEPLQEEFSEPTAEQIIAEFNEDAPAVIEESKSTTVVIEDDLEIIEGIGPKIAKLLKEAGIMTFAQLADADVTRLKDILLVANLRVNDPTSWPEQAKLAAAGKVDDLKHLQDQLKGGRA